MKESRRDSGLSLWAKVRLVPSTAYPYFEEIQSESTLLNNYLFVAKRTMSKRKMLVSKMHRALVSSYFSSSSSSSSSRPFSPLTGRGFVIRIARRSSRNHVSHVRYLATSIQIAVVEMSHFPFEVSVSTHAPRAPSQYASS